MDWPELELYLWTYAACMWVSFGLYARSHDVWRFKEGLGRILHGANSGMLAGWASSEMLGTNPPWPILLVACGTSMGWTKKGDIVKILLKMLSPNGKTNGVGT